MTDSLSILGQILCERPLTSVLVSPLLLLVTYKIYQYLWSIPRISRQPSDCYILVTGCGRGFGNEIVKRLDSLGCHVFAGCRSERGMKELATETSERCHVLQMDISNSESVKAAYDYVKAKIPKGQGLWGLVNNAGISGSRGGPAEWNDVSDYQEVLNVNLLGTIHVTNTFLPLIKSCKGRVVMISSMYARLAFPVGVTYAVSKFAIEGFSDCLRRTLKKYGCGVHIIEPGIFKTNIVSDENLNSMVDNTWASLTPELKEEFGPEFKEQLKKYVSRTTNMEFFNKLSMVAEAVEQALLCRFARARYIVGNDAKFLFLPLHYMPEWFSDWAMDALGRPPMPSYLKKKNKTD